jgi:hypothetical protein
VFVRLPVVVVDVQVVESRGRAQGTRRPGRWCWRARRRA